MSAAPQSDDQLDRLLRQVRIPSGLGARLTGIVDKVDTLEHQLRAVPVPGGMHSRLSAVVAEEEAAESAAKADEAAFDARLRSVVVPWGLHVRLRSIVARRPVNIRRLMTMAALFLLLASWESALFVAHYAHLFGSRPDHPPFVAESVVDLSPIDRKLEGLHIAQTFDPAEYHGPSTGAARRTNHLASYLGEPIPSQFARVRETELRRLADERSRRNDIFSSIAWKLRESPSGAEVLGARPQETAADTARAAVRRPRGIDAKLNAGDRMFLLDYGVFPLVSTREFTSSVVPLTTDTAGYEATRAALAAGEWPAADMARPEDFLAATDFGYGRPNDKGARLYAAGAIAPWAPSATPTPNPNGTTTPVAPERIGRLLQLSVQARELPPAARKPMRLTVGIDVTESMRTGGTLAMVKRALAMLVERLEPNDRLTLVALGGANPTVVEEAGRAELEQLLAAVDSLRADGGGNLADGITTAISVAARREPPKNVEQRVVILSDAFDESSPDDIFAVSQFLKAPAARQLGLDLIDLRHDADATAWDALVRGRSGRVSRAATTERIRSAIFESLTGRNQTVAQKATLTVTFNPATVVAYRLVGHEPSAIAGLPPRPVEIDLAAGQTGTLLYELQLNGGKDQLAATVVLRWTDPTTGAAQETTQAITRGTLGPAFDKATPQLQLATIAAATAAKLRNSPWGDNVAPDEVLQWTVRLERSGTLRGVAPWRELLVQMQRLPARRTPTRGNR